MKSYVVYNREGVEFAIIKAGSHNAAEAKAIKKFGAERVGGVCYTEI